MWLLLWLFFGCGGVVAVMWLCCAWVVIVNVVVHAL